MDLNYIINFVNANLYVFLSLFILFILVAVMYFGSRLLTEMIKDKFKKIVGLFFKKKKDNNDNENEVIVYNGDNGFIENMMNNNTIMLFNEINEGLAVLRSEMSADRAFIIEFHNGQIFASKNHRWKASKTYEKTKIGTSFESYKMQNMEVTLYWSDYFHTFYTYNNTDILPPGFSIIRKNPECKDYCSPLRYVYLLDVSSMDKNLGPMMRFLEKEGIAFQLLTPIITTELTIVGCLGIDYCKNEDFEDIINQDDYTPCSLCRFASDVSMMWENNQNDKQLLMDKQRMMWNNYKIFPYLKKP